jgi:hypothetical protein
MAAISPAPPAPSTTTSQETLARPPGTPAASGKPVQPKTAREQADKSQADFLEHRMLFIIVPLLLFKEKRHALSSANRRRLE